MGSEGMLAQGLSKNSANALIAPILAYDISSLSQLLDAITLYGYGMDEFELAVDFIGYRNSETLAGYLILDETGLRSALNDELTWIAPYISEDIFEYEETIGDVLVNYTSVVTDGLHADITTALSLPNNPQSKQLREQIIQAVYAFYFRNLYYLNSSLFESSGSLRSGGAKVQVQKAGVQGGSAKGRGLVIAAAVTWDDIASALNWLAGKCKIDDPPPPPPTETWTLKCNLSNVANETAVQGFAVGTQYCYSFEVKGPRNAENEHYIYRYDMINSGNKGPMDNGGTLPALLHANDAALGDYVVNENKEMFIYVAAWSNVANVTNSIVKLQYDTLGNYQERARYNLPNDPSDFYRVGGVAVMSGGGTSNATRLLLKRQEDFYVLDVASNSTGSTTLPTSRLTHVFTIDLGDYTKYTPQSFHYENVDGGTIYVPMFGYRTDTSGNVISNEPNKNAILVYRNVNSKSGGTTIYPESDPWIIENKGEPNSKFEIEAIGFPISSDNRLWFNTNEADSATSGKRPGGIYTDSSVTK